MRLSLAVLVLPALASTAAAQRDIGTITITLKKQVDGDLVAIQREDELDLFNRASCECHSQVAVVLTTVNAPAGDLGSESVEIWTGTNCGTFETTRDDRCTLVATVDDVESLHNREVTILLDVAGIMFPKLAAGQACPEAEPATTIWALVDEGMDGTTYEHIFSLDPGPDADTESPPPALNPVGGGGEDAIGVEWDLPEANAGDIAVFQLLCATTAGEPIFAQPTNEALYNTTLSVCGQPSTPPPGVDAGPVIDGGIDAGPPDAAPVDAAPTIDGGVTAGTFDDLDPRFVCGQVSQAADSARIDVDGSLLTPSDAVFVKLLSIDDHGNFSEVDVPGPLTPGHVSDFWEIYEDEGGQADGGFCFVATAAYGDYDHPYVRVLRDFRDDTLAHFALGRAFIRWYYAHSPGLAAFIARHEWARVTAQVVLLPVVGVVALWEYTGAFLKALLLLVLVLAFRFRKQLRPLVARRRLVAAMTGVVVLLWAAGAARAQVFLEDEDNPDQPPPGETLRSAWAIEIKAGPYFPAIDDESGVGSPYERMFGDGASFMAVGELERFFLYPYGQLGAFAQLGYMRNSAASFVEDDAGNPTDVRSPTDHTAFFLLPTALGVVYRHTYLADKTPVPLVPYAKLGLAYYVWWITKGDGSIADTPDKGDAFGGTLGWQGTVGLSLRADQFDRHAARAMAEDYGVEHVGLFFELTYADVSGLWMSNRLHVGDFTWYAGLNFEF